MKRETIDEVASELLEQFESIFPGKVLLTRHDVMKALECEDHTVETWTKRPNAARRPPRVLVGGETRFPKKAFVRWFVEEQMGR